MLAESVFDLDLLGRWDEALARVEEAEQVTSTSYDQIGELVAISVHCARGEPEKARTQLMRLAAVGQSDDPQAIAAYAAFEARLLRVEGRLVEALTAAERALAERQEVGLTWAMKVAVGEALEASFALGDQRIREHLAALDATQPGGLTPLLRAQQARFRARLAGTHDPQAETDFAAAEDIFRRLETPFHLAVTLIEHAELLRDRDRPDDAEPLLAEAREIFERLHAKPWLDRAVQATQAERQPEVAVQMVDR